MPATASECTQLLLDARSGDREAFDRLWPFIYDELRIIAHARLLRQRADEALNTTALVHEAYLKLIDGTQIEWKDRAHFFAVASRAMRFILIDLARARLARKRGGAQHDVDLESIQLAADGRSEDLISLDIALTHLAGRDARLSELVELRFFGGLTYEEIAAVTGRSVPTVKRDWTRARAWLYQSMQDDKRSNRGPGPS